MERKQKVSFRGKVLKRGACCLSCLLILFAGIPAFAQSDPDAAKQQATIINRLLKRIDELEASQQRMQAKLDQLSGQSTVVAPAAAQPAAPVPTVATVAEPAAPVVAEDSEAHVHRLGPVEFQGFSDFDYGRAWFEKQPPTGLVGSPNSFNIGDFDLFTNTRISDHWSVLGELLITSDFTNEFGAELDRLLFTYKANKYFQIGFGKYNTALGFYPNEFHRARYFMTATSRPIMYSDEDNGGILPVHNIGVTATGMIPSGTLGLHWVAEVANGRSASHPDVPIQNFVDENNGKAVNFALYARPEALSGFQAGVSVYRDTMHPANLSGIGQTIYTGHIVYVGSRLEWLNEASLIRNDMQDHVFHSLTSYTQLSYAFGKLRPYFRYDYQNVPASDPVFAALGRENGPSVGVYRHLSNYVVLKLQYGRLGERDKPSANDLNAQLAFAF
jgi:hypothetical protein